MCPTAKPSALFVLAAAVAGLLAAWTGPAAHAATIVQYSFENNLLDTAPAGAAMDNLTGFTTSGPLAVSYAPGIVGQAVRVSRNPGEAAVLQAANSADLQLAPAWTIEAFVRPDTPNANEWHRFATKWFDATGEWHWAFRYGNNGQDLYVNGGQNVVNGAATGTVPYGQWTHVAVTGDPAGGATGIKLWQNGVVVGTAPYQAVAAGTNAFRIGNSDAGAGNASLQFFGLVDEFLIQSGTAQGAAYMQARSALLPVPALVHSWRFDGDFLDSSPSGNDGTAAGGPGFVAGRFGSAVNITAASQGVDDNAAVNLPLGATDSWSMNVWAKLSSPLPANGLEYIAGFGDRSAPPNDGTRRVFLNFGNTGGNGDFYFWGGGRDLDSLGNWVGDNAWHMYTITYNGSYMNMYLDGNLVRAGAVTLAGAAPSVHVGNPSLWNSNFRGAIDEFTIWSGVLSAGHVASLFEFNLARVPEPSTWVLLGLGAVALVGVAGRRRKQ